MKMVQECAIHFYDYLKIELSVDDYINGSPLAFCNEDSLLKAVNNNKFLSVKLHNEDETNFYNTDAIFRLEIIHQSETQQTSNY